MRVALLFEPHPDDDGAMPDRPVVPLLPGVAVSQQVPRALKLPDEADPATLVLHVDGTQLLRGEAAGSFDEAPSSGNDARWMPSYHRNVQTIRARA